MLLHRGEEEIRSNSLKLRVAPPRSYDEEYLAQDYFSEDVGRILTFDGSKVLEAGNDCLQEVVAKLGSSSAAIHARVALAEPNRKNYKTLPFGPGQSEQLASAFDDGVKIKLSEPKVEAATASLDEALLKNAKASAESLGHVDFKYYVDNFTDWLHGVGDSQGAASKQAALQKVLSDRGVKKEVVAECDQRQKKYKAKK